MLATGEIRYRIRDNLNRGMAWRQDRVGRSEWTLRLGLEPLAYLEMPGLRRPGRAVAYERSWWLRKPSAWASRMVLEDGWTGRPVGEVVPGLWGTRVVLPAGTFRYKPGLFQGGRVLDPAGRTVLRMPPKFRWFTMEADVEVDPHLRGLRELPDLVVAAWVAHVVSAYWGAAGATAASATAAGTAAG